MEEKRIIIGIAGGTGSGKSTVAKKIGEKFGEDVTILCHDFYYKCNDNLKIEERQKINYDHPNAFDTDMLISDLKKLKNGQEIQRPIYSFVAHNREKGTVKVKPKKVIIVEGILIFENQELIDLMDIKIFVDTDADIRIIRRIVRDVEDRGRSLESVITQYKNTVKPMHEQFVEPSKKKADVIIPEGGYNVVAVDMVMEKIRSILGK